VLSNVGPDGGIVAPTDRQVLNNRANQSWHHDSSFKPVPARLSILSAREIPSVGGNTEFAAMRAAFAALEPAEQARLRGLSALHDFAWSRRRVDPALVTEAEAAANPPVRQPVVRAENPHGAALYLGAHARVIEGWDEAESRALIERLVGFAGEARFVYSHRWSPGDVLVWDNRAVMHRATPFAATGERRRMVRTTVAG
jgi:alpha-ketoglutarate-dependent 2,4-dichlorophenoxyacetate dioxygenase